MRFQDTLILSEVTWNLYASWNNKSILKTKQEMVLSGAPRTKMPFLSPLYNKGAFSRPGSPYTKMAFSRPPIQKMPFSRPPYTTKSLFRDPPIQKMPFSIPPYTTKQHFRNPTQQKKTKFKTPK